MTGNLKKAIFEIYENKDSARPKDTFSVLFNPSEYSISGGANYSAYDDKSGNQDKNSTKAQNYTGPKPQVLSLELFFDTSAKRVLGKGTVAATDVSIITKKIVSMTRTDGELHMPPAVCFRWGSLKFRGYVDDLKTTYNMFTAEGKPVRAKMSLTIKEQAKSSDKYMEPFESPDRSKIRCIREDMSVWSISQTEYGTPGKWRLICEANGISDPLDIPSGTYIKVPALY